MLKWTLITLGGLLGCIGIVLLIGVFLPLNHTASRTAKYAQAPAAVWAKISDFAALPEWQPGVQSPERLADRNGHPVWKFAQRRRDYLIIETVIFEPPHRMVGKIVDNQQFGGTWTYVIQPTGDGGCTLTITEDGAIYNPMLRVIARFVAGYQRTMVRYLKALGGQLGEEVVLKD